MPNSGEESYYVVQWPIKISSYSSVKCVAQVLMAKLVQGINNTNLIITPTQSNMCVVS